MIGIGEFETAAGRLKMIRTSRSCEKQAQGRAHHQLLYYI
jgi:hypothetical protein